MSELQVNKRVKNFVPLRTDMDLSEQVLQNQMRKKLAQLQTNKSLFLPSYLHTRNSDIYKSQLPLKASARTHTQQIKIKKQIFSQL